MSIRFPQRGEINILAIPLVLMVIMFVTAAGFGYWAFTERQDYKNNTDQKVAAAVEIAKKEESIKKDQAFAEAEKRPLTVYKGPSAYGSIRIEYPKTWSVYVDSKTTNPQPLDAYLNPRVVPSISDQASVFALRVKVLPTSYPNVAKTISGKVKNNTVKTTPYALPKVPEIIGMRVDGQVGENKKLTGAMVIFPLRDKTIQVWTENAQSIPDFENIILPNLSFEP